MTSTDGTTSRKKIRTQPPLKTFSFDDLSFINDMLIIRHYIDNTGRDPFADWRETIRDTKARIAIDRRIMRVESGNFGDHKPLREGV